MFFALWWLACTSPTDAPDAAPVHTGTTGTTDTSPSDTSDTSVGSDTSDTATTHPTEARLTPSDVVTDHDLAGLRISIDHVEGLQPSAEVLDLFQGELDALRASGHLVKPSGIDVVLDETLPATGIAEHTFEEVSALLRDHIGPLRDDDTAVLHALYVDGGYQGDTDTSWVLGFAWGGSYVVIFPDNIAKSCARELSSVRPGDQDAACDVAETSVWMHELGHLFGLVDLGTPMTSDHEDPDHEHHDSNPECLMYWQLESSEGTRSIGGRFNAGQITVPTFDEACRADLLALQAP